MITVHCEKHGLEQQTWVCQHIADDLRDRKRVGFFWTVHDKDNPHPDAWCSDCECRVRTTGDEWIGEAADHLQPKMMCEFCYDIAKVFHMGCDPWS